MRQADASRSFACRFSVALIILWLEMLMKRVWFQFAVAICLGMGFLNGCGSGERVVPTGTVSGTVTLNGKPFGGAVITFFGETNGDTASSDLQSDGTYSLMHGTGFSVPAGDYRVSITPGNSTSGPPLKPEDLMKTVKPYIRSKSQAIADKYRDPKTSTLVAVVKEGTNPNISFDLK